MTVETRVEITFDQIAPEEWRVIFTASAAEVSAIEFICSSIRVHRGVFQAVRELLEVRQPGRLFIPEEEGALAELLTTYRSQQKPTLKVNGRRTTNVHCAGGYLYWKRDLRP